MTHGAGRVRSFFALCLLAAAVGAAAEDARIAVFERYNHAGTYDEIKPILSGVLARQYALVASHDAAQVPKILSQQQLASYRPRIVDVDGTTSFLILESVATKSSRTANAQAYLMSKSPTGTWTLANRLMPESIVKTLWTRRFTPAEFVQASSCVVDGTIINTQSALAVRRQDSIEITLYPFKFSQADLEYWRQASGMNVTEAAVAGSHFNGRKFTVCRLIVTINEANQPSLLNVGFDDPTGSPERSNLWQATKGDVSTLAIDHDTINLVTAGAIGGAKDGFRWNVAVKIPVWQRGL